METLKGLEPDLSTPVHSAMRTGDGSSNSLSLWVALVAIALLWEGSYAMLWEEIVAFKINFELILDLR